MTVVTICSDFGAQENKIHHHFTFPLLLRVPKVKCVFRFTAGLRGEGTDFPCSPPPVSTPSRWSVVTAGEPAWMRPCHRVPSSPESHSRRRVSSGCGLLLSLLCPESPLCRPSVLHPPPPRPRPRAPLVSLWLHSFVFSRASSCWPHTACHRLRLPPLSVMVISNYRDVLSAWVSCERFCSAPQGYSGRGACPVRPAGFSWAGSWWNLLAISSELRVSRVSVLVLSVGAAFRQSGLFQEAACVSAAGERVLKPDLKRCSHDTPTHGRSCRVAENSCKEACI